VFPSINEMARRKAKTEQPRAGQVHPKGGLMSVPRDERLRMRARREEMGLRQEDAAARINVVPATISNIESGRSVQVKKSVYAKYRRLLFRSPDEISNSSNDEVFAAIVDGAIGLRPAEEQAVRDYIETLKRLRQG
jgi:transcriptional regulator with XRE-family HTH domain